MASCTIYYPGLLGPAISLGELSAKDWPPQKQINNLAKLLSAGHYQSINPRSIEATILSLFGADHGSVKDPPVSNFRVQQKKFSSKQIWCLDPVYVQIDRDEAILLANEALELEKTEAEKIIHDLNKHFLPDGLKIHYHRTHQWLLESDLALATSTVSEAMLKNVNDFAPVGEDMNRWRAIINEIEMLLYSHPVNIDRMERGALPVNSLWIWGAGQSIKVYPNVDLVLANDAFVKDVANYIRIEYKVLPAHIRSGDLDNRNSLLIYTDQLSSIKRNDVFGWFESLCQFDHEVIGPLINMLKKDIIQSLILQSDTLKLVVTKKDLNNPLRRLMAVNKSFRKRMTDLRGRYGYDA
jgi:hypothetical protein